MIIHRFCDFQKLVVSTRNFTILAQFEIIDNNCINFAMIYFSALCLRLNVSTLSDIHRLSYIKRLLLTCSKIIAINDQHCSSSEAVYILRQWLTIWAYWLLSDQNDGREPGRSYNHSLCLLS